VTVPSPSPRQQIVILGGSLHLYGGLEAFCDRAATAITRHSPTWQAAWWPTETAYFSFSRLTALQHSWWQLDNLDTTDLVWLQWSTLLDLLFLWRAKAQGVPVLVTPHLGARSRLQRSALLRRLSARLLARADRLGLLFDGQVSEIELPAAVPCATIGTFLPEEALTLPVAARRDEPLRLFHAGRLSADKGTFRMIELCALLQQRGIPFSGQIVGRADPDVTAAIVAAIEAAGLAHALTLTGWMDGAALRDALGRADVLVHLSELDAFPLIVLEALAAGALPIVADMAGAAYMVRRYDGFLASGSSVAAAADWLAGQGREDLRQRGASAAAAVRHDHAWPMIVARLEQAAGATRAGGRVALAAAI
jgi:glycosyltransferase involved in cell wall biosynthesis